MREDLTLEDMLDWNKVTSLLAAQEPLWPLDQGYAYHAITHGWLIGEVIRRITGKTPGQYFAEVVAAPLGVEAWIGLPETPKRIGRRICRLRPACPSSGSTRRQSPVPTGPIGP